MYAFLLTSNDLAPHLSTTDPIGWDALKVGLVRDPKYHGVAAEVSLDLTFVKQAGAYIRTVYEARGAEGVVRLTIFEQNPNELRFEQVHAARLDLSAYRVTAQGVTVPLMEAGLAQKLVNLDDVQIDVLSPVSLGGATLPPLAPVTVGLHSQAMLKRYAAVQSNDGIAGAPNFIQNQADDRTSLLYFGLQADADTHLNEFDVPELAGVAVVVAGLKQNAVPIYTTKEAGQFTFDLDLYNYIRIARQQDGYGDFDRVYVSYYFQAGSNPEVLLRHEDESNINGTYNRVWRVQHQGTYQLQEGDDIYLYAVVDVRETSAGLLGFQLQISGALNAGSYLKFEATTTTAATTAPGVLVYEAVRRAVEAITDQPNSFYSEYYGRPEVGYAAEGAGSLRLLTPAFWVRGFPVSTAPPPATAPDLRKPLAVSLSDAFASLNAIDCLGMGLEQRGGRQVVRWEPRAYFYPATTTLELGYVSELSKSAAPEYSYTTAELGYQRWQSGADNGLQEINGKRTFVLPTGKKNQYQAQSPYAAAGYLIEQTRRDRFDATSTKEGGADNQTFIISLVRTAAGYEAERNEAFSAVTGLLSPETTYNLRLTPGRSLRRHGAWLRAGLIRQPEAVLQRGAVEGYDRLSTQLRSETAPVAEGENVPAADLPAPYFYPETYEFTARLRFAELRRLAATPYGRVSFLDAGGRRLSGHLLRLDYSPSARRGGV